ncbi:MAG: RtcB family protein [Candidatus Izemoplasmatales bacterium]
MYVLKGKYTSALITSDEIEESCINQIYKMINNCAFTGAVVIQADAHAGKGSVVGFTMPLGNMLIPNVIGVDIGCGMLSANIGKNISVSLKELDDRIRRDIPMGINAHKTDFKINSNERFSFEKHFPWRDLNDDILCFVRAYNDKYNSKFVYNKYDYKNFQSLCKKVGIKQNLAELSIGTLGGGNHFIEMSKSEISGDIWITIHSGSRNFGKMVCEYHQKKAKKNLDTNRNVILKEKIESILKNTTDKSQLHHLIAKTKNELGINFNFNINGMEFLEGNDAFEYLFDMIIAQKYAQFNRKMMLEIICNILKDIKPLDVIESVQIHKTI